MLFVTASRGAAWLPLSLKPSGVTGLRTGPRVHGRGWRGGRRFQSDGSRLMAVVQVFDFRKEVQKEVLRTTEPGWGSPKRPESRGLCWRGQGGPGPW